MPPHGLTHPSTSALPARGPAPRVSVAVKLTLLVGFTLALLLAVLLTASWIYWRDVLRRQVDSHLSAVAASRRDLVRTQIDMLLQRVELNTDRGEMRGLLYELENEIVDPKNRAGTQATLEKISDGQPIVAAALADKDGLIVVSTDPTEVGQNFGTVSEFIAGSTGPHLGRPRWAHGRYEALLAAPIRTRANPNRIYGVLLATADVSQLANTLRDVTGLGETGESILCVRDGDQLRFLFNPRNAPRTTHVPLAKAPALAAATGGVEAFSRALDYRGVRVLATSRPIGYGGWGLVLKMDESEAYAPITRSVRLGMLFGLLVSAVGLVTAYAVALSFTRPLRRLAQGAARVAEGDYDATVRMRSGDEFGALATAFNEMTKAIGARSAERDRATAALQEADRRKDEFLAMLGHELRNPVSAITSAVRLWKEAPGETETSELAQTVIERQTANLSRHVDDLLDVVRISEGRIDLRREPMQVGEAIRRAARTARTLMEEKRQLLELSLTENGQASIEGDPTRIEQIMTNLLINAAKYTPVGGHIRVEEKEAGDDVIITVSDDGIGIAPDLLPEIFELFTQADHSLARTAGGLGIGLNLCRQLVELHGGSISVHSAGLGRGAEFTVRLPALRGPLSPAKPMIAAPPAVRGPGRRILIVDDNQDTLRLLSRLLIRRGHEVTTAGDGLAALQIAQEFQPEILLLDIGLPGLDGYSLARRLRADGFSGALLIAISGYAQESDREQARDAGFDHHFAKPVDFDALCALIGADHR